MNAFASSSTTLSAMRQVARPSRIARLPLHLTRAPLIASRNFTSPSPFLSSARLPTISSKISGEPDISRTRISPTAKTLTIRKVIKDFDPLLSGSPSGYLIRRAFSTSLPSRTPTTASPATQKASRSESEDPSEDDEAEPDPNLSAYDRLKLLFKRYGWYALGMYTVLSALDFSLVFVLIHLAGAERIEPVLNVVGGWYRRVRYGEERADELAAEYAIEAEEERKKVEAEEKEGRKKKQSSGWMSRTVLAEMALAYPIHKVALLPVRAGLTVAWTPKFVGWLTRRGWVGKGGYTRAASHAQDKLRTAKERVKERVQDLKQ